MKKKFLLLVLVCPGYASSEQKSFIGKNRKEIRGYWSARVSPKYLDDGFWAEPGDPYFSVMTRKEGRPDFEATFDKATGKCASDSQRIKAEEVNTYKTKLRNLGFAYNAPENMWLKEGVKYVWKIQQYYRGEFVLACEKVNLKKQSPKRADKQRERSGAC